MVVGSGERCISLVESGCVESLRSGIGYGRLILRTCKQFCQGFNGCKVLFVAPDLQQTARFKVQASELGKRSSVGRDDPSMTSKDVAVAARHAYRPSDREIEDSSKLCKLWQKPRMSGQTRCSQQATHR